jgi:hypothetical protein
MAKLNRRKFLVLAGGGVIVAAGAGTGFWLTRSPAKALAPWRAAGTLYSEPRKRALSYAILAPNPHNRQPWLIDLVGGDKIMVYADTDRLLPATDPLSRQITIGLGCFLELLRLAAAEDGYHAALTPFPEGFDDQKLDRRPVAEVTFTKQQDLVKDVLFRQVLRRRSLKEPYDPGRPVPDRVLTRLASAAGKDLTVGVSNDIDHVKRLRRLTHEALALEIETPHTYKESVDLFRIGRAEIEANPDGIDFSGPLFETLKLLGLFNRKVAMDKSSSAYRQGIDAVLANCDTAMAHIWLVSKTNTRLDQLAAGRAWLRINLAAARDDVGTQPLSQALQEFPEMAPLYERCHKLLAPQGGTVQMLARLGYAAAVAPSPRWQLDRKLMRKAT